MIEGKSKPTTVKIRHFNTPNYVMTEKGDAIHIRNLETETVEKLLDEYRKEVLRKHHSEGRPAGNVYTEYE